MLSDPAAAAWAAAGQPAVDAPAPTPGRCGRCGENGLTVTSSRIISEKFTGFDSWPFGTRRLCVPCAWAYSHQPTQQTSLLITGTSLTKYSTDDQLAPMLAAGPLTTTQAAVVPTTRRRHILPTAEWGHVATDGFVTAWDATAAQRLADLAWLRTTVAATWPKLSRPTPPAVLLTAHQPELWAPILQAWESLQSWRKVPPLWALARVLTNPAGDNS